MKAGETIVLALVLSLALAPVLVLAPVSAQSQYSEKVDVYTAGSSAYWFMTMDRLSSAPANLTAAEASAGLSSYRLLAMSTQSAVSDFQVFGLDGYNVLKVPSMPAQGLFLTVNASSASAASPLVSYFASRFATGFTLVSSGSGSYVYFAPVNFVGVAAPVLFRLLPTAMKGFSTFVTEATLTGLAMPSISLSGSNNGTGFSHSITIGAASSSIITSSGAINLPGILSNSGGNLTTSTSSSSSEVVIHSLDGVIQSSDSKATVANVASAFSGTYTLSVSPGAVVRPNATVTSLAPTAIAYREFDRGTLTANQSLAVTIVIKDTAATGSIQNVTVNDNWWQSYSSVFKFVSGNYSFTIPLVSAGQNVTKSYFLQVVSGSSTQVTVPASRASFLYTLSGSSYRSGVTLNQAVLQINNVGPALVVTARPSISSGAPLGTAGNYTVTLTNSGNSPAINVRVGGTSIQSLPAGGSQTVNIPVTLTNLARTNFTQTFPVVFTNSAQQTVNITSNSVSLLFSHSAMVIPFIQLATNETLTAGSIQSRLLDVTYTFSNKGSATSGSVTGTDVLPSGVSCTVIKGNSTGSCSGSTYTMTVASLTTQNAQLNTLQLRFSQDNFVIPPGSVATTFEGATLHTFGGAFVIPAGMVLTKSFGLGEGFPGMTSSVSLGMTNLGSGPVFNATLSSTQDIFDSIPGGSTTVKTYATLAPKQSESFNYTVALTSLASGNSSASPATVSLVYGGLTATLTSSTAYMEVFKPVTATVSTSPPTPEEEHDFTLSITLANTASVPVSDLTYTFTLPSGLTVVSGAQVSGRTVTVSLPSLGPDANQTVQVTLVTSTGLTFETSSSQLSFHYQGFSLNGVAPKQSVTVGVDVTTRYTIPIVIAVLIAFAGLVYMRRRINPAVQA